MASLYVTRMSLCGQSLCEGLCEVSLYVTIKCLWSVSVWLEGLCEDSLYVTIRSLCGQSPCD